MPSDRVPFQPLGRVSVRGLSGVQPEPSPALGSESWIVGTSTLKDFILSDRVEMCKLKSGLTVEDLLTGITGDTSRLNALCALYSLSRWLIFRTCVVPRPGCPRRKNVARQPDHSSTAYRSDVRDSCHQARAEMQCFS